MVYGWWVGWLMDGCVCVCVCVWGVGSGGGGGGGWISVNRCMYVTVYLPK